MISIGITAINASIHVLKNYYLVISKLGNIDNNHTVA